MNYLRSLILFCVALFAAAGEPVLVVNADLGLTEIDAGTVKKIFTARDRKWPNDVKAELCLQKSGDTAEAFNDAYIGRSPKKLIGLWKKQVFAGKAKMPEVFESDQEVLEWVAATEGAGGYVDSDSLAEVQGVVVVTITE